MAAFPVSGTTFSGGPERASAARHRAQARLSDYVFGSDWDVMTSTTKARQHGFHDVVDSEEMFVRLLKQFRTERIVP